MKQLGQAVKIMLLIYSFWQEWNAFLKFYDLGTTTTHQILPEGAGPITNDLINSIVNSVLGGIARGGNIVKNSFNRFSN